MLEQNKRTKNRFYCFTLPVYFFSIFQLCENNNNSSKNNNNNCENKSNNNNNFESRNNCENRSNNNNNTFESRNTNSYNNNNELLGSFSWARCAVSKICCWIAGFYTFVLSLNCFIPRISSHSLATVWRLVAGES